MSTAELVNHFREEIIYHKARLKWHESRHHAEQADKHRRAIARYGRMLEEAQREGR